MKRSRHPASPLTVRTLFEAGQTDLRLQVLAGKVGLDQPIREAAFHRPGLALAGFFRHFPFRRVQVLGLAECAYLSALTETERRRRLTELFHRRVPCVVITRGRNPMPELTALAEETGTALLRSAMVTRDFINAATILIENLAAPRTRVQGTMIEILGIGVLLEGKPGLGKSEIALTLIKRGHALVADDVTALRLDSAGAVLGSAVDVVRYHMEIRGLGIIHVPSLFGVASVRGEKRLDLVVSLRPAVSPAEEPGPEEPPYWDIFGVRIPRVILPVAPGRNLADVVEAAALNQKLRSLGHDAEKEFDERLIAAMTRGKTGSE